jgi:hypothetical protein
LGNYPKRAEGAIVQLVRSTQPRTSPAIEPEVRFCRGADRDLDEIERADPARYELVAATLRAAVARPPKVPVLPFRCRTALDGHPLSVAQAGHHAVVLQLASHAVAVVCILPLSAPADVGR